MDFFLKFLILGGKYLTQITAQSIIEAYKRSMRLRETLSSKFEKNFRMTGHYENILELYNDNLDEISRNAQMQMAFISDAHRMEFEAYLKEIEEEGNLKQLQRVADENMFRRRSNVIDEQFNKIEDEIKSDCLLMKKSNADAEGRLSNPKLLTKKVESTEEPPSRERSKTPIFNIPQKKSSFRIPQNSIARKSTEFDPQDISAELKQQETKAKILHREWVARKERLKLKGDKSEKEECITLREVKDCVKLQDEVVIPEEPIRLQEQAQNVSEETIKMQDGTLKLQVNIPKSRVQEEPLTTNEFIKLQEKLLVPELTKLQEESDELQAPREPNKLQKNTFKPKDLIKMLRSKKSNKVPVEPIKLAEKKITREEIMEMFKSKEPNGLEETTVKPKERFRILLLKESKMGDKMSGEATKLLENTIEPKELIDMLKLNEYKKTLLEEESIPMQKTDLELQCKQEELQAAIKSDQHNKIQEETIMSKEIEQLQKITVKLNEHFMFQDKEREMLQDITYNPREYFKLQDRTLMPNETDNLLEKIFEQELSMTLENMVMMESEFNGGKGDKTLEMDKSNQTIIQSKRPAKSDDSEFKGGKRDKTLEIDKSNHTIIQSKRPAKSDDDDDSKFTIILSRKSDDSIKSKPTGIKLDAKNSWESPEMILKKKKELAAKKNLRNQQKTTFKPEKPNFEDIEKTPTLIRKIYLKHMKAKETPSATPSNEKKKLETPPKGVLDLSPSKNKKIAKTSTALDENESNNIPSSVFDRSLNSNAIGCITLTPSADFYDRPFEDAANVEARARKIIEKVTARRKLEDRPKPDVKASTREESASIRPVIILTPKEGPYWNFKAWSKEKEKNKKKKLQESTSRPDLTKTFEDTKEERLHQERLLLENERHFSKLEDRMRAMVDDRGIFAKTEPRRKSFRNEWPRLPLNDEAMREQFTQEPEAPFLRKRLSGNWNLFGYSEMCSQKRRVEYIEQNVFGRKKEELVARVRRNMQEAERSASWLMKNIEEFFRFESRLREDEFNRRLLMLDNGGRDLTKASEVFAEFEESLWRKDMHRRMEEVQVEGRRLNMNLEAFEKLEKMLDYEKLELEDEQNSEEIELMMVEEELNTSKEIEEDKKLVHHEVFDALEKAKALDVKGKEIEISLKRVQSEVLKLQTRCEGSEDLEIFLNPKLVDDVKVKKSRMLDDFVSSGEARVMKENQKAFSELEIILNYKLLRDKMKRLDDVLPTPRMEFKNLEDESSKNEGFCEDPKLFEMDGLEGNLIQMLELVEEQTEKMNQFDIEDLNKVKDYLAWKQENISRYQELYEIIKDPPVDEFKALMIRDEVKAIGALMEVNDLECKKVMRNITHKLLDLEMGSPRRAHAHEMLPLFLEYKFKIDEEELREQANLIEANKRAFLEMEESLRVVKIIDNKALSNVDQAPMMRDPIINIKIPKSPRGAGKDASRKYTTDMKINPTNLPSCVVKQNNSLIQLDAEPKLKAGEQKRGMNFDLPSTHVKQYNSLDVDENLNVKKEKINLDLDQILKDLQGGKNTVDMNKVFGRSATQVKGKPGLVLLENKQNTSLMKLSKPTKQNSRPNEIESLGYVMSVASSTTAHKNILVQKIPEEKLKSNNQPTPKRGFLSKMINTTRHNSPLKSSHEILRMSAMNLTAELTPSQKKTNLESASQSRDKISNQGVRNYSQKPTIAADKSAKNQEEEKNFGDEIADHIMYAKFLNESISEELKSLIKDSNMEFIAIDSNTILTDPKPSSTNEDAVDKTFDSIQREGGEDEKKQESKFGNISLDDKDISNLVLEKPPWEHEERDLERPLLQDKVDFDRSRNALETREPVEEIKVVERRSHIPQMIKKRTEVSKERQIPESEDDVVKLDLHEILGSQAKTKNQNTSCCDLDVVTKVMIPEDGKESRKSAVVSKSEAKVKGPRREAKKSLSEDLSLPNQLRSGEGVMQSELNLAESVSNTASNNSSKTETILLHMKGFKSNNSSKTSNDFLKTVQEISSKVEKSCEPNISEMLPKTSSKDTRSHPGRAELMNPKVFKADSLKIIAEVKDSNPNRIQGVSKIAEHSKANSKISTNDSKTNLNRSQGTEDSKANFNRIKSEPKDLNIVQRKRQADSNGSEENKTKGSKDEDNPFEKEATVKVLESKMQMTEMNPETLVKALVEISPAKTLWSMVGIAVEEKGKELERKLNSKTKNEKLVVQERSNNETAAKESSRSIKTEIVTKKDTTNVGISKISLKSSKDKAVSNDVHKFEHVSIATEIPSRPNIDSIKAVSNELHSSSETSYTNEASLKSRNKKVGTDVQRAISSPSNAKQQEQTYEERSYKSTQHVPTESSLSNKTLPKKIDVEHEEDDGFATCNSKIKAEIASSPKTNSNNGSTKDARNVKTVYNSSAAAKTNKERPTAPTEYIPIESTLTNKQIPSDHSHAKSQKTGDSNSNTESKNTKETNDQKEKKKYSNGKKTKNEAMLLNKQAVTAFNITFDEIQPEALEKKDNTGKPEKLNYLKVSENAKSLESLQQEINRITATSEERIQKAIQEQRIEAQKQDSDGRKESSPAPVVNGNDDKVAVGDSSESCSKNCNNALNTKFKDEDKIMDSNKLKDSPQTIELKHELKSCDEDKMKDALNSIKIHQIALENEDNLDHQELSYASNDDDNSRNLILKLYQNATNASNEHTSFNVKRKESATSSNKFEKFLNVTDPSIDEESTKNLVSRLRQKFRVLDSSIGEESALKLCQNAEVSSNEKRMELSETLSNEDTVASSLENKTEFADKDTKIISKQNKIEVQAPKKVVSAASSPKERRIEIPITLSAEKKTESAASSSKEKVEVPVNSSAEKKNNSTTTLSFKQKKMEITALSAAIKAATSSSIEEKVVVPRTNIESAGVSPDGKKIVSLEKKVEVNESKKDIPAIRLNPSNERKLTSAAERKVDFVKLLSKETNAEVKESSSVESVADNINENEVKVSTASTVESKTSFVTSSPNEQKLSSSAPISRETKITEETSSNKNNLEVPKKREFEKSVQTPSPSVNKLETKVNVTAIEKVEFTEIRPAMNEKESAASSSKENKADVSPTKTKIETFVNKEKVDVPEISVNEKEVNIPANSSVENKTNSSKEPATLSAEKKISSSKEKKLTSGATSSNEQKSEIPVTLSAEKKIVSSNEKKLTSGSTSSNEQKLEMPAKLLEGKKISSSKEKKLTSGATSSNEQKLDIPVTLSAEKRIISCNENKLTSGATSSNDQKLEMPATLFAEKKIISSKEKKLTSGATSSNKQRLDIPATLSAEKTISFSNENKLTSEASSTNEMKPISSSIANKKASANISFNEKKIPFEDHQPNLENKEVGRNHKQTDEVHKRNKFCLNEKEARGTDSLKKNVEAELSENIEQVVKKSKKLEWYDKLVEECTASELQCSKKEPKQNKEFLGLKCQWYQKLVEECKDDEGENMNTTQRISAKKVKEDIKKVLQEDTLKARSKPLLGRRTSLEENLREEGRINLSQKGATITFKENETEEGRNAFKNNRFQEAVMAYKEDRSKSEIRRSKIRKDVASLEEALSCKPEVKLIVDEHTHKEDVNKAESPNPLDVTTTLAKHRDYIEKIKSNLKGKETPNSELQDIPEAVEVEEFIQVASLELEGAKVITYTPPVVVNEEKPVKQEAEAEPVRRKIGMINNLQQGSDYSPIRIFKNSIWNWDANQRKAISPQQMYGKEAMQYTKAKKAKEVAEVKQVKKYKYERKEIKSALGKPITVTYLVEDGGKAK